MAHERVSKSVSGIDSRKAGDSEHDCSSSELNGVSCRKSSLCGCGDDVIDLAALKKSHGVVLIRLVDLRYFRNLHSCLSQSFGCSVCRIELEAHEVELLCDLDDLHLVGISYRDEYAAALVHLVACCHKALIQCFGEVSADA